jgi:hypothetical protein
VTSGQVRDEDRDQDRYADRAAAEQREAEHHGLGHAVEERPDGDRGAAARLLLLAGLLVARALAVPRSPTGQRDVRRDVHDRAAEEAEQRRRQAAVLLRLVDEVERERRDQYPGPERHHRRHDRARHPGHPGDTRPDHEGAAGEESPESRFEPDRHGHLQPRPGATYRSTLSTTWAL